MKRIQKEKVVTIDKIAAFLAGKSYNDFMANVGISGETGVGKSTLALWLALRMDKDFDIVKNVAYTRNEIIEKAYKLPKRSVLIVDEAIGGYRRRAMESIQKDLVEMINKIRYKNHVIIWNLPFFVDLDRDVRKHFDLWIHIPERGKAVLFRKDRNPLAEDPWMPEKWVRRYKAKPAKTLDEVYRILKEHPLYETTFRFPPLPQRWQYKYRIMSEEAKSRLERQTKGYEKYLSILKTTRPKMLQTYVWATIVLGGLYMTGKITKRDIKEIVTETSYKPIEQIDKMMKDLLKNPVWFTDVDGLLNHIVKKTVEYTNVNQ